MKRLNVISVLSLSLFISLAACDKKKSGHGSEKAPDVVAPEETSSSNPENEPKLDEKAPEKDPSAVPVEVDADPNAHPFKATIIGTWTECLDTTVSSSYDGIQRLRSTLFTLTFDAKDNLEYMTEDFFGTECKGEVKARDIVAMHYTLGSDQGGGAFDFDMSILNEVNKEVLRTTYTSIKMSDSMLLISLGHAFNSDFGNGESASTRYRFPADPSYALNMWLSKVSN